MNTDQDAVNAAAIAHSRYTRSKFDGTPCEDPFAVDDFKAGVAWARANPGPEVLALQAERDKLQADAEKLAEGLERVIRWVEVDALKKRGENWEDLEVGRQALKEWRGEDSK